MQRNFVSGGGGGSADDCNTPGVSFRVFRSRGTIDMNEGRIPNVYDVSVVVTEPIAGYDYFMVAAAGVPAAGVQFASPGVSTAKVGDYLVYMAGDPTLASSWTLVSRTTTLADGMVNSPPNYVRIVGDKASTSDAS